MPSSNTTNLAQSIQNFTQSWNFTSLNGKIGHVSAQTNLTSTNTTSIVNTTSTNSFTDSNSTNLSEMIHANDTLIALVNSTSINSSPVLPSSNTTKTSPVLPSSNTTKTSPVLPSSNTTNLAQSIQNVTQSWNFTSLNGKVGHVTASNNTLQLQGTGYLTQKINATNSIQQLTLSAWVKPDYTHGSPVFTVISKENQFILSINNNIQPRMIAQFSVFDGIKWDTVNSTIPIQNWTHLAATYNGSAISIYVNGTLQSTDLLQGVLSLSESGILQLKTPNQITSNSDVVIGGSSNSVRQSVNNEFSGLIKNVKIYDSLLTPFQISQIYNQNNNVLPVTINNLPNPSLAENVNVIDSVILSLNSINSTVNNLNDTLLTVAPSINKTKKNYLSTEDPEFVFQYFSNNHIAKMVKQIKSYPQKIQYGKWQEQDKSISIEVYDPSGNKTSLKSEFTELSQGKFDIKLHAGREVKPGLYKIKITMIRQGKSFTVTDQYTWGLVSVNTLRSIYVPGEQANFAIVVLDNNGHPVCNSDITMSIRDPESKITTLSSGNGISSSNDCGLYNANYIPNSEGNYTVNVMAKTPDGISSFNTYFLTMNNFDFNIIRTAASKIDPINNPNSFNVKINVESFVNSSPITISESVPSVFNVVTDASVTTIGDSKILTWNKDLIGNKTSLQYSYSVPLQFPMLYTLGPVKITYGNNQTFTEARPWFVANDPAFTPTANDIVQITESATLSSHQFHTISTSDTMSLSEKTSTSIPVKEILQLSEKISTSIPVKEILALSDSASPATSQFKSIAASDTLALADSGITHAGRLLSPSDTVALSEMASIASSKNKTTTETVISTDTVSVSSAKSTTLSETVTTSDVSSITTSHNITLTETVTAHDSTGKSVNQSLTDSPIARDALLTSASYSAQVTSILIDNTQTATGTGTSITIPSFTVSNGANRYLLVAIETNGTAVSSVTYGAQSLSLIRLSNNLHRINTEIWGVVNPTSGTGNVVVDFSPHTAIAIVGAYNILGVDQTNPIPTTVSGTSGVGGGSPSVFITNQYATSIVIDSAGKQIQTISTTAPQAQTWNLHLGGVTGGSSTILPNISTSNHFVWTPGSSIGSWAEVAVEVKASGFISPSEIIHVADTLTIAASKSITLSETVTVADHTVSLSGGRNKILAETVTASDVSSTVGTKSITLTEIVTSTDQANMSGGRSKAFTETVTASDSLATAASRKTTLTETVTTSDVLTTTASRNTTLSETVTTSDVLTTTASRNTTLSETVIASDALLTTVTKKATLSETVTASDVSSTAVSRKATLSETVTASDVSSTAVSRKATLSETVTASDVSSTAVSRKATLSE
ncbi:MAG: hypothetical protein KGI07_09585, partial [Thaumarchaeota archaeon]|nr:hypothetical protein [Nitrososphaerota archaeon]